MQQISYRSALQATPRRHKFGVSGINSRVQDTAWLLSHVAQPAGPSALPPRRRSTRSIRGINSRVQDTAWLLSHVAQPAGPSALPPIAKAGLQGAANAALSHGLCVLGAGWLTQGLILAMGAEFVTRMMSTDSGLESLKKEAELEELARKAQNANNKGVIGYDRTIAVYASPFDHYNSHTGLGNLNGAAGTVASIGLPIASKAIVASTPIASSATWIAAAGGPIGLAVVGVTTALALLFGRKKPGQKVATTEIVNSVEPLLQDNLNAYMNGPRTVSSQQQALANFDAGWEYVVQNCSQAQMGTPGKWCVDDRKPGGKWDWFARYRDPIANDTDVKPDPGMTVDVDPVTGQAVYRPQTVGELTTSMNLTPLLLAGALAFVAYQMG